MRDPYGVLADHVATAVTRCGCGHLMVTHGIATRRGQRVRTGCSVTTVDGPCPCKTYEEAP